MPRDSGWPRKISGKKTNADEIDSILDGIAAEMLLSEVDAAYATALVA